MAGLERDFVEACVAQLRYDYDTSVEWFGRDVPMIALGHTAPFFAKVADALFERSSPKASCLFRSRKPRRIPPMSRSAKW